VAKRNFNRQPFHAPGRLIRGNPADTLQHPQFDAPSDLVSMGKSTGKPGVSKKKKGKKPERRLRELGAATVAGTLNRDQARVVVAALEPVGVSAAKIARIDRIENDQERRDAFTALSSRLTGDGERVDVLLRDAGCADEFMEQARGIVMKTLHVYSVMVDKRLAGAKMPEPLDGPQ
jgi:hypothetical protein